MFILLSILAIGAAYGTFIENDFGTLKANELVYNSIWYETILFLSSVNLLFVIHKTKMYRVKARFLFHTALVVILIGAALTRYFAVQGTITIHEGDKSDTFTSNLGDELKLPFEIQLNDFILLRYPGSKSPSSFSSEVTIIDAKNNVKFDQTISMNNTLLYSGYKFYQNSYTGDEKEAILSINKDPGSIITYIGYAMLFLGLILSLFDKKSRFRLITKKIKKMPIASFILLLCMTQTPSFSSEYVNSYINDYKTKSKIVSEEFGKLVVQARMGRIKSLDTLNREILRKLSKKESLHDMSANQIVLGMFTRPDIWKEVDLIHVKTAKLKTILRVPTNQKLLKFSDFFFPNGNYKIAKFVEEANKIDSSQRGTFYNDVIRVDERLNISFVVYNGAILKLFPIPNEPNNKWASFKPMFMKFKNNELKQDVNRFLEDLFNWQYDKATPYVKTIAQYQDSVGEKVIPTKLKREAEILLNKINIFSNLSLFYILFGLVLLFYALNSIFFNRLVNPKVKSSLIGIAVLILIVHTLAIALRWYVSGYAPISNTYETMVYIAYSSAITGVIFFRQSMLALSCSVLVAGIFLFSAHLGNIDPEITNLVPVLKSLWLSIHVSVIVASYGFFGVASLLSFMVLVVYIFRSESKPHLDKHIKNITLINEATLIIGITLLVIGNFLGGIWANESWGRYWGWDPKETWTYISIIIYTLILHLRLIKNYYSEYLFNVLSLLGFGSILMTYYGVNYYLAGLHSYATGDPVPIPTWVYVLVGIVIVLIMLSYKKRNLKEKNEKKY
jgi:cytochrome c-type biogenesis protein CcsB